MDKADNLEEITGETLNALPHLHHPKYTIHNQHGIKKVDRIKHMSIPGISIEILITRIKKPAQQLDSC